MSLVLFNCPRPSEPPTVNRPICPENIGQIQRVILQRAGWVFDAGADPAKSIKELASWTPLITAVNDTKIAITPYLNGFTIGKGEALKEGGNDNSTVDGVEVILGIGFGPALGFFKDTPVKILDQLRLWMSEANADPTAVVWYGLNNFGKIICKDLNPAITAAEEKQYGGLPLQALFVSEPDNQGLNTRDTADFGFSLAAGWTENRAIVTPNFSVRTQLLAPVAA